MSCPATRHFCDNKDHRQEVSFCGVKDPMSGATCMRMSEHDGDHSGYAFSITTLESWA
jgi:hypothetical protein